MYAVFDLFWDILLSRRGPQDVPAHPLLARLCLLLYVLSGALLLVSDGSWPAAVTEAALELGLLIGSCQLLLRLYHHPARYPQTITAITGAGTLLTLIAWPISLWLLHEAGSPSGQALPAFLHLLLLVWQIRVLAHIWKHALNTTYAQALAWAVLYIFLSALILNSLFPSPLATTPSTPS